MLIFYNYLFLILIYLSHRILCYNIEDLLGEQSEIYAHRGTHDCPDIDRYLSQT